MEEARGDAGLNLVQLQNRFYDRLRSRAARRAAEGDATARGFGHLQGSSYCLLVSYRQSGEPMPTPVWFGVADGGKLHFRTDPGSAKVKRIRRNPRVRVAPCTTRGKPTGPAAEGRARILPEEEVGHAEEVIQSNYGLGRRLYEGAIERVIDEAAYVEVTPA